VSWNINSRRRVCWGFRIFRSQLAVFNSSLWSIFVITGQGISVYDNLTFAWRVLVYICNLWRLLLSMEPNRDLSFYSGLFCSLILTFLLAHAPNLALDMTQRPVVPIKYHTFSTKSLTRKFQRKWLLYKHKNRRRWMRRLNVRMEFLTESKT
jgi:hypothetical protein